MPDAAIHWRTAFAGLEQDDAGVTVRATSPEGQVELRAKYVVGADGAGSAVRKALGLAFDGMTWPERFVATNLHHDFESGGYWQSTMVVDDEWGAVIVKITREGLWRCTYMEDASLPEATYVERIPAAYRHLLPGEGGYELVQSSPYKMHQRCAETFRKGRVLLAGDAAHVTNPTGGFGLTTGLFDAYSLWPTLAAVILDEYTEPHRPFKILYASVYADVRPSFIVDITAQFERRMTALLSYTSQYGEMFEGGALFPNEQEIRERLAAVARFYGNQIGVKYGEPFVVKEAMQIDDIVSMPSRSI